MQDNTISIKNGSVWEAVRVALPLIIAASGHAIKLFTDRLMLSHYDGLALAAALSSGVIAFTMMSFWLGTAMYTNSFVAQYIGADRPERVGPAIWQGIFLSVIGGLIVGSGYFWGENFITALNSVFTDSEGAKKSTELLSYEVSYFRIITGTSIFFIINAAVLSFWNGRGKTWVVAGLELFGTIVNVVANYVLIFGDKGVELTIGGVTHHLPGIGDKAYGIVGAGLGTGISGCSVLLVALFLVLRKNNREKYNTLPKKLFDPQLFWRLIKFGMPSGVHFILDIASFSVFVNILSGINPVVAMASSATFSVNAIAFIPMTGLGMTASIFVGQCIGAGKVKLALKAVRSCLFIVLTYMAFMGIMFNLFPDTLLSLFPLRGVEDPQAVYAVGKTMFRYMACFLFLDGMFILYNSAIKGAGDTKYSMWMGITIAWLVFALPCYISYRYFHVEVWTLWKIYVGYAAVASALFYIRYRRGKWQRMKVIEN